MTFEMRERSFRFPLATLADLPFIDRLRRLDSKSLGFLSHGALAEKIRLRVVRLAVVDGVRAGFVLHGSLRGPEVRVFQLAVDPAFRGQGVGRRLVSALRRRLTRRGVKGLSLRCRESLPANKFWHANGFRLHDLEPARRGALFVWVQMLQNEATAVSPGGPPGAAHPAAPNEATASRAGSYNAATQSAPNEATGSGIRRTPAGGGQSIFRFHSRWHPCPRCGRKTCDTWSAGGVRRRTCAGCNSPRKVE